MDATILYQAQGRSGENEPWLIYRCALSNRCYFDRTEACYKARWLVRQQWAVVAQVITEKEGVIGRWVWNKAIRECVQEKGPDL